MYGLEDFIDDGAMVDAGIVDMENMGGGYSSPRNLNGFSGKSRSSTFGPKVLGLLFGLETDPRCPGSGDSSMGGGILGIG